MRSKTFELHKLGRKDRSEPGEWGAGDTNGGESEHTAKMKFISSQPQRGATVGARATINRTVHSFNPIFML